MNMNSDPKRHIGFFGATGIGVGAIVGGGILALAGVAFSLAGPSAIVAFVLNGGIAFITAMSFAVMSSAFPESGGAYTFTKKVFSVKTAFAVGWILWFASIMAGLLYAMGFSSYLLIALQSLWNILFGSAPEWIASRPMVLFFSAIPVLFYTYTLSRKVGGGGQWETIGKIALFSVLIIAGLFFVPQQSYTTISGKLSPFFDNGLLGVFKAMGYTFITFQGFDLIAAVAGEIKNPERNIPASMFTSLIIAICIYLPFLFIISTVGVSPGESITSLSHMYPETLVAAAVYNYLGPLGYWLTIIAAILSMLSALYANLLASSRIAFAMAQDRTLPRFLKITQKSSGTPLSSLYISAAILLISLFAIPDLAAAGAAASLVFLLSFSLVHITTILAKLRGGIEEQGENLKPRQIERHKKINIENLSLPLLPLLGFIFCFSLAVFQAIAVPDAGKIVSVWLAAGFVLYFTVLAGRAELADTMKEARDPRLVKLRGRAPLVLVPIANPSRAQAMVEVASALSPPEVGRALLLSIVAGSIEWAAETPPHQLSSSQDVIREALTASYRSELAPEALITVAPQLWPEIIRVARVHRCESLLIGLSDISHETNNLHLEKLISVIDCDAVFLKSPPEWRLSQARRILVPVRGKGDQDELRARLLGSLCRSSEKEITFLQIVPEQTTEKEMKWNRYKLTRFAEDEVPIPPKIEVVRSNNVIQTIREYAAESDFVILGTRRLSRYKKIFGELAIDITHATPGAVILISRRG